MACLSLAQGLLVRHSARHAAFVIDVVRISWVPPHTAPPTLPLVEQRMLRERVPTVLVRHSARHAAFVIDVDKLDLLTS